METTIAPTEAKLPTLMPSRELRDLLGFSNVSAARRFCLREGIPIVKLSEKRFAIHRTDLADFIKSRTVHEE